MARTISRISTILTGILLLCLVGGVKQAQATHIAACDMYLTYIGGGQDGCSSTTEYKYIVTLDIYTACETGSAGPPSSAFGVQWGSVNAGVNGTINLSELFRDTVDQLCAVFKDSSSCHIRANQQFTAYILNRFTDTLILPSAQKDWIISYSTGARNRGIDNIETAVGNQNPQGNLYVEVGLNNLTKYNNSTPRFTVQPLPYICVNQPASYLNGPIDPNGDSLITVNRIPLNNNATTEYFYQTPKGYTAANPVNSSTGYSVDPVTGTASFTPTKATKMVLAFRCTEYERGTGEVLGYITRDVQISVFPCAAPPPAIQADPQQLTDAEYIDINDSTKAIIVCPGSDMEFTVSSQSANPNSKVYMEANTSVIPGSGFSVSGAGTNSASGTFTWTPSTSDIGEHTLIITTKDSTCSGQGFSIVLKNYTVLQIKVIKGLDAGPDITFCEVNPDLPIQLFVKGADLVDVTWTTADGGPTGLDANNIANPKLVDTPAGNRTYIVTSPQLKGNCVARDEVNVVIDTSNAVKITPVNPLQPEEALVMCNPGYLQLEALLKGRPPKNNVPCGVGNPTICADPDTGKIYGSAVYGKIDYDSIGSNTPVMYNTLRTNKQQYLIRNEDMDNAEVYSSTIRSLMIETQGTSNPGYQYSNFRIFIKCTNKDSLRGADGFENFGMTEVFYAANVTFEDGVHEFPFSTPYNWDTTRNLLIQLCYSDNPTVETGCGVSSSPAVVRYVPTTYTSGLILAGADATQQNVCGIDKSAAIKAIPARPTFSFTYCEADPLPFDIVWKDGPHLSDSTITNPLAYVPGSTRYIVQTVGRSGCIMRDTLDIYVPEHDFSVTPTDTAICFGEKTPITAYGGWRYRWYEFVNGQFVKDGPSLSCFECQQPVITPERTTDYKVVISDSVFCYDTLDTRIEVMPLPDVRILTGDTTVKYGKPFQVLASGARLYNWNPSSSLNNPNISYPIAQPTEDTRYVLGGIAANGCKAFDTLYVTIDDRDNLFVPSAFSPNGDGKNDKFEITNLTFQKVMEFRVFNRQGQEIFTTTANDFGWDGRWKGVDQPMGVYHYLIRVAYPDGLVETYKGDVTLIR